VYEITFDVPDEGLLQVPLGEDRDNTSILVIALDDDKTHDEIQDVRRHPTRARRSVVGNQPYDTYEPRITFLQLGNGASAQECTRGESPSTNDQGAKTPGHTTSPTEPMIDDAMHEVEIQSYVLYHKRK